MIATATTLHDRGSTIFSNADVLNITGLSPRVARNFAAALVRRGVATRLKPGLFILVPYELGHEPDYLDNPFVVARELAGDPHYFVSHASNRLRERLTASYTALDPMMPDEGKYLARWRLRLNVEPEELESVVRT